MLLADIVMLLGASFLWVSGRRFSTWLLVAFLCLVGSFLARLCIGLILRTYALNSLKRRKKQMHVYRSHTFLVKVVLVLSLEWTHPENVTCQVSLGEQNIHQSSHGIDTWAVVKAWQLHDVGNELFHMLHKLMHVKALELHEHFHDIVSSLLSRVAGKHGEKVEQHTIIKGLVQRSPRSFLRYGL